MTHKPERQTCTLVFLGALLLGGCGGGGVPGGDVPGSEVPASTDSIGPIRDLEAAAAGTLYLLDAEGDLYLSDREDSAGGRSWRRVDTLNFEGCTELSAQPLQAGALLAICADTQLRRSSDGGLTWVAVLRDAEPDTLTEPAFHPLEPNIVHAGPYRSEDGGWSWTNIGVQGKLHVDDSDAMRLYDVRDALSGPRTSVWRSDDGGATWIELVYPEPGSLRCEARLHPWSAAVSHSGLLLLVAYQFCPDDDLDPYWYGVYHSVDGGVTWTIASRDHGESNRMAPYDYGNWRFERFSDNVIYAFDSGISNEIPLFVSENGTVDWSSYGAAPVLDDHLSNLPGQESILVNIGTPPDTDGNHAVYRSPDRGVNWLDTGLEVGDVDLLEQSPLRMVDMGEGGIYFYERYEDNHDVALDGLWWTGDGFETFTQIELGLAGQ